MSGDRVGEDLSDPERTENLGAVQDRDFSRNGDGEVGGNLRKRKGGLIMRVGGRMGSSWAANGNV